MSTSRGRSLGRSYEDIARIRMRNERLIGPPFAMLEEGVGWLGAVQAQDYPGAKWALAQRTKRCTDADVDEAFQRGAILRTHVMRPTWHFVLPEDIRWMLELTAPRVRATIASYDRALELDDATIKRTNALLAKALRGGEHLTRKELADRLEASGIPARGQRLGHIMMHAELSAVVCSGPRRGKQFTYALLEERAPAARTLARDEALAELTRRYFKSHGPAQLHDYVWWSGLKVADAREGIELVKEDLVEEEIEGKTYRRGPSTTTARLKDPTIHLLPNYDEYFIAFKDRRAILDDLVATRARAQQGVFDKDIVTLNGRVIGGWERVLGKGSVRLETRLLVKLQEEQRRALAAAAERFARFLRAPTTLSPAPVRSR